MKYMLTKLDMARIIVQALYNSKKLPAVDNINVKRMAKRSKIELNDSYKLAHKILTDSIK